MPNRRVSHPVEAFMEVFSGMDSLRGVIVDNNYNSPIMLPELRVIAPMVIKLHLQGVQDEVTEEQCVDHDMGCDMNCPSQYGMFWGLYSNELLSMNFCKLKSVVLDSARHTSLMDMDDWNQFMLLNAWPVTTIWLSAFHPDGFYNDPSHFQLIKVLSILLTPIQ